MIKSLTSFFNQLLDSQEQNRKNPADGNLAIAALLCQVTQADHNIEQAELNTQTQMLIKLLDITEQEASHLLSQASIHSEKSASLYEFTDKLRELSHQQRFELIKSMWQVAYADEHLDPIEEAIIRKAAELLYVNHSDFIRAKLTVSPES